MNRKSKVAGLATIAALALSIGLPAAAPAQFESEVSSPTLTVSKSTSQTFKLSATSEIVFTCQAVVYDDAEFPGVKTTTLTVSPTYANCLNILGQAVSIDMNGCDYVFHLADDETEGSTDIECPTSTGMLLTVGTLCTYEFDSQTGLETVDARNLGTSSTREVELDGQLAGITSTRTTNDSPFICPPASSSGVYSGSTTLTGSTENTHRGFFVD